MDLKLSVDTKKKQDSSVYDETYDFLIIGGGAAGYTAGIYASRFMIKTIILAKNRGGTIIDAHVVENYPGFKSISGMDLMKKFEDQVKSLNVPILDEEVVDIDHNDGIYHVKTDNNKVLKAKQILFATGTARRKLNIKGEENFLGKGVSYCATCDAFFFKEKTVGIVGGSDAAATAALLLSQFAKQVYIIYRGDKLRAEPYWVDIIEKDSKIKIITNANVLRINGDNFVKSVDLDTGENIALDGVFIEIGSVPTASLTKKLGIELDDKGYIKVDASMKTNIETAYAAGDVSNAFNQMKQLVTAVTGGAIAAETAYKYIKQSKKQR